MLKKFNFLIATSFCILLLASCSDIPTTGETPTLGSVRVLHLSANAGTVDLLFDNRVFADTIFAFFNRSVSGTVPRFTNPAVAYLGNTGYIGVETGTRNLKVFAAPGGVAARPPLTSGDTRVVAETNINVGSNKAYTVFVSDTAGTTGGIIPVVVEDAVPSFPDLNVAQGSIRFGHFSPNAPAVRILATRTSSPGITNVEVFSSTSYKQISGFTPIDSGTFRFNVVAGSDTVLTVNNQAIARRRVYTLLARGLVGGAGAAALGATIYFNN
ncbi:MAG: DUF4397 domain-containing protein [Chloroherpetonaceae bacterium]|nr:DUF4397 domain-containing protein [Chloroherpetonaceae bacterium]